MELRLHDSDVAGVAVGLTHDENRKFNVSTQSAGWQIKKRRWSVERIQFFYGFF
jgi:hypothetical protein